MSSGKAWRRPVSSGGDNLADRDEDDCGKSAHSYITPISPVLRRNQVNHSNSHPVTFCSVQNHSDSNLSMSQPLEVEAIEELLTSDYWAGSVAS